MYRTYDAKAFDRTRERSDALRYADQRWLSIYTWTVGLTCCVLALVACAFSYEAALCTLGVGAVCLFLNLWVRPWYSRRTQKKLNFQLPPLDLDS